MVFTGLTTLSFYSYIMLLNMNTPRKITKTNTTKHPMWYKIVVYSLYSLIAFTMIAWFGFTVEKAYYESLSEIENSKETIRNSEFLKRMKARIFLKRQYMNLGKQIRSLYFVLCRKI